MRRNSRKGIMGIGTLIIFIASILVAAVAAAVLISTSNVLQQRSLLVGQEARKAITDAVEVVSILAAGDPITETFNEYEILIRLSPGSDPIQMRSFDIQFISPIGDDVATLAYDDNNTVIPIGIIENATNTTFYDVDGDETVDHITLVIDAFGTHEGVKIYLSEFDDYSELISLRANLNTSTITPVTLNVPESPIIYDETVYGYLRITGTSYTTNTVDANATAIYYMQPQTCEFDKISAGTDYCFVVMNGNDDLVLGSGERFKLLFKTRTNELINIGEDILFIFTSEKGRLSEARARAPDVITSTKVKLWPLG